MKCVSICFLGLCLSGSMMHANIARSQGLSFSTRNLSLGGAALAGRVDAYSVMDQPAGLSLSEKPELAVSILQHNYSLDPSIPEGQSQAWESPNGLPQNPQKTSELKSARWLGLGMNLPLVKNINFGLAASMPSDRLVSIYAPSNNDPQYLLYNSRAAKPELFTALSMRLPFGLSVGGGLYYSLKAEGHVQIAASADRLESRLQLDLKPEYLPYGGLQWVSQNEAGPVYTVDFTYRSRQSAGSRLDVDLLIQTEELSLPLNLGGELIPYYDPETLKLAFAIETQRFNIYLSGIDRRWSAYKPPVVDVYGNDDPGAGRDDIQARDLGLKDARSYHLGLELPLNLYFQTTNQQTARFGAFYQEAATEKSVPRLLLLDTNKYALSMGYGLKLPAGRLTEHALDLAVAFEKIWLLHRNFHEESNSNRVAQAGGQSWTVQAGVGYAF